MSRNGERRPPRPRIELVGGAPTADEGAAVVAALERFLAESAPPPRRQPQSSPWQRAALVEGISARQAPLPLHPRLDR